MRPLDDLFAALAKAKFRQQFHLNGKELAYLQTQGLNTVLSHGDDFINRRLAPAWPVNDGRQTPFHGHPVFVGQHATGCCCRGCLQKWHQIPPGRLLTEEEKTYLRTVLERGCVRNFRTEASIRF